MTAALSSAERVLWRRVIEAALVAAREPASVGKTKALKKSMAGWEGWRHPDLRPLPRGCFRAFLYMATGWVNEPEAAVRAALAGRLEALADAAGDILDGLVVEIDRRPGAVNWQDRADLR